MLRAGRASGSNASYTAVLLGPEAQPERTYLQYSVMTQGGKVQTPRKWMIDGCRSAAIKLDSC